jgi:hypothetical protein
MSRFEAPLTMRNLLEIDLKPASNNCKITAWVSVRTALGRAELGT